MYTCTLELVTDIPLPRAHFSLYDSVTSHTYGVFDYKTILNNIIERLGYNEAYN